MIRYTNTSSGGNAYALFGDSQKTKTTCSYCEQIFDSPSAGGSQYCRSPDPRIKYASAPAPYIPDATKNTRRHAAIVICIRKLTQGITPICHIPLLHPPP